MWWRLKGRRGHRPETQKNFMRMPIEQGPEHVRVPASRHRGIEALQVKE